MRAYNVEFFDRNFNFITNQMVPDFTFAYDYLSQSYNVVTLLNDDRIKLGQYIRVTGAVKETYGIVVAIDEGTGSKKLTNVSFAPLTSLLDVDILFDTDLQGTGTLEGTLKTLIENMYVNNSDISQNVYGLSVVTTSATTGWGFNLKSTNEGMHHLIINFFDSIIARGFTKYQVVVDFKMDFGTKTIVCTIGKVPSQTKVIEADLPNIVQKNVVVDSSNEKVNKATIYNGNNYSQMATFYLHTDGTYDTQNRDRVTPVDFVLREVLVEQGQSFADLARAEANDIFGDGGYNNLIELEMLVDDELVGAGDIEIGQIVSVLSAGQTYTSILSGYNIDKTITLVFGIIRLDLTKQIRRK